MKKPSNDRGTGLPQDVIEALASTLLPSLHDFFESEDEQQKQEPISA